MNHPKQGLNRGEFIERYGRYFGEKRMNIIHNSGRYMVERFAEGPHIFDTEERSFLDFWLASGVFNLGHRHPVIMQAMEEAMRTEEYGHLLYSSEAKGRLAETLAQTTPEGLEVVLPAVTGSEAVDQAVKMAMGATGRKEVIHFDNAYHGCTGLSFQMSASALRDWADPKTGLFKSVPGGDIKSLRNVISEKTAAVITEPMHANYDAGTYGAEYFAEVRRLCDEFGVKLIIDEVVCGMGRLGTLWGSESQGCQPDMLVTAKGLSGGVFPMAAVVMRPEIIECWGEHPYRSFSTFAWSNVGAVVARTAIEETQKLLPEANRNAEQLESTLNELAALHSDVLQGVRRTGLLYGLDLNPEKYQAITVATRLFERGVIVPPATIANPNISTMRLMPPLTLNDAQIAEFAEKLDDVLSGL